MAIVNAANAQVSFTMSSALLVVPLTPLAVSPTTFNWRANGTVSQSSLVVTPASLSAFGNGFAFDASSNPTAGVVSSLTFDLLEDNNDDVLIDMNGAAVVGGLPNLFPLAGDDGFKANLFWSSILYGNDTLIAPNSGNGDMMGDYFQVVSTVVSQANLTGGNDRMSAHSIFAPARTLQRGSGPEALVGDAFLIQGTTFNNFLYAAELTGGNDDIRLTGFAGLSAIGDAMTVGEYGFLNGGADVIVSSVTGAPGLPSLLLNAPLLAGDAYEVFTNGDVSGGGDRIIGTNYAFLPDGISGDVYTTSGFVRGGRDSIDGRAGQDQIAGDVLLMRGGTVWGGSDVIRGGVDSDLIAGDVLRIQSTGIVGGGSVPPVIDFRGGNDFIYGDSGNDLIAGDILDGAVATGSVIVNGNDTIFGGDDDDQIYGDSLLTGFSSPNEPGGDDILDGGLGDDYLDGQGGNDTAAYNSILAAVTVNLATGVATGQGTDSLVRIESVIGSGLSDTLSGDTNANRFTGGLGNDVIDGSGGLDTAIYSEKTQGVTVAVSGSTLVNVVVGGVIEDRIRNVENIIGGSGNDQLAGDGLANELSGGAGNDRFQGLGGADKLDGGLGADTAIYAEKNPAIQVTLLGSSWATVTVGGVAEDQIRFIENIIGGAGGDTITGDSLANALEGLGGNDTIRGGLGNDRLDGGAAIDTADYSDKGLAVSVALNGASAVVVSVGGVAEDTISNFENLRGGTKNDVLTGDGNANQLEGGSGNDTLNGQANNDILTGGLGIDTLTGGLGADRFQFLSFLGGADVITDFTHLSDDIVVSAAAFGGGLAAGALAATRLVANAAPLATQAFGQFLYETDTGKLTWDQNGTAAGGQVVIATLTTLPTLTNLDFVVVA
jgi:Ca2+-binding RTX toxin-like protein